MALGAFGAIAYLMTRAPERPTSEAPRDEPDPTWEPPRGLASAEPVGPLAVRCYDHGPPCAGLAHGWCDRDGQRIACCAPGLVPDSDGLCECPPGGTDRAELLERGCEPVGDHVASLTTLDAAIDRLRPAAAACLEGASATHGRLFVRFVLTPRGDVFDLSIEESSVPSAQAQRCVLDALRGARFPPVPDGRVLTIEYPFTVQIRE